MSKSRKIQGKKHPPPKKTEICKEVIDKVKKSRTFNPSKNSQTGNRIVRLQEPGESIIGWLGWPITNFRESTSYPIKLESGEIVEILGNKLLHKLIRQGNLCGQKVEIVYQGRDYAHGLGGHYRKVYRAYKYTDNPTVISKDTWNKIIKEAKRRHPDSRINTENFETVPARKPMSELSKSERAKMLEEKDYSEVCNRATKVKKAKDALSNCKT